MRPVLHSSLAAVLVALGVILQPALPQTPTAAGPVQTEADGSAGGEVKPPAAGGAAPASTGAASAPVRDGAQKPKVDSPPTPIDADVKINRPPRSSASPTADPVARTAVEQRGDEGTAESGKGEERSGRPRILRGTDTVIAPSSPRETPAAAVQESSFKFEQAPIREVIHAILGDLLGLNYVIHQPVTGTVTVSTQAPIPADRALAVLETVLQANGILIAQDASGMYHVGSPEALRGVVPVVKRVDQAPLPAGYGTAIIPLKFVGAAEMAEILRPMARAEAFLRVDTVRNLLVLAGTRSQIEGWLDIVKIFDVDLLKGMSVGVFPLQYASVRDIDTALRALGSSAEGAPSAGAGGTAAGAPLRHPLWGALRILPLERLNSILVITPRASYLDEIKRWIERLDRPTDANGEARLFVYPVRNGSARHLSTVLSGLFGTGGGQQTGAAPDSGVAPGLRPITGATGLSSAGGGMPVLSGVLGAGGAVGAPPGLGATGAGLTGTRTTVGSGVTPIALSPTVRVIGDELNNAVLVYASAAEFRKIEETLRRLDIPSAQVMIEASIIEVTLNDDLQYGLQWYFTNAVGSDYQGTGQLNPNRQGSIGPVQPGFSYTVTNTAGQVRAVLNALAERSLIKVISSPSLMVLDNHTASITVGNQQPIRSSETVTTGGNVTTSIQYKDTGVLLTVTPSVNAGDLVSMTINQSTTDVGAIDAATGQRAFLQRQIASRVAVRSGEAIILGGLIRDNTTSGSSGLPWLSRLPIIGFMFGNQTRSVARTELLVVITPRVVRTEREAREVGQEMRDRMRAFETFDERQQRLLPPAFGGTQPQRAPQGSGVAPAPQPSQEGGKQ